MMQDIGSGVVPATTLTVGRSAWPDVENHLCRKEVKRGGAPARRAPVLLRVFAINDDYFDYFRASHAILKIYGIDLPMMY